MRTIPIRSAASRLRPTKDPVGNSDDLERLLEQLGEPVLFKLGHSLPDEKFLPQRRIGRCPAAHNEALIGEKPS